MIHSFDLSPKDLRRAQYLPTAIASTQQKLLRLLEEAEGYGLLKQPTPDIDRKELLQCMEKIEAKTTELQN